MEQRNKEEAGEAGKESCLFYVEEEGNMRKRNKDWIWMILKILIDEQKAGRSSNGE